MVPEKRARVKPPRRAGRSCAAGDPVEDGAEPEPELIVGEVGRRGGRVLGHGGGQAGEAFGVGQPQEHPGVLRARILIGVVSATALTGGALAVAAAPASAATWHGCYGYGCIGKYPQAKGCSSDASTVYALSVYDGVRKTRVTLRLRYSPDCQSEWAIRTG